MRPHRHRRNGSGTGFKCLLVLQATIGLLQFNSECEIHQQLHLSAKGPTHGIEIAEDQFHTLVALEADSVIFELKKGLTSQLKAKTFSMAFPRRAQRRLPGRSRSGATFLQDQA